MMKKLNMFHALKLSTQWQNLCLIKRHFDFVYQVCIHLLMCLVLHGLMWFIFCVLQKGMMLAINSTRDLSLSVGKFYLPLNQSTEESTVFSLPYIDSADGGKWPSLLIKLSYMHQSFEPPRGKTMWFPNRSDTNRSVQ